MNIVEIAKKVKETHSAIQCRRITGTDQYDTMDYTALFVPSEDDELDKAPEPGSSSGWILLDAQTANVITLCYEALERQENRDKFLRLPLHRLAEFCWSQVG